jgi:hypothetical protein
MSTTQTRSFTIKNTSALPMVISVRDDNGEETSSIILEPGCEITHSTGAKVTFLISFDDGTQGAGTIHV